MSRNLRSGVWRFPSAILQPTQSCSPPIPRSPLYYGRPRLPLHPASRHLPLLQPRRRGFCEDAVLRATVDQSQKPFAAMSSAAQAPAEGQQAPAVESLTLHSTTEQSKFPDCYPSLNPVDIYRAHIAENLSKVTGIDALKIYPRLMWTNTLDKGDLVLPVCYP